MCEKPFAADLAEAERMLDAAERAGVVHMLGTEFRFATGQALAGKLPFEGSDERLHACLRAQHGQHSGQEEPARAACG